MTTNTIQHVRREEHLFAVSGSAKQWSHYGNQFFKGLGAELSYHPVRNILKGLISYYKDIYSTMLNAVLFTTAKTMNIDKWIIKI